MGILFSKPNPRWEQRWSSKDSRERLDEIFQKMGDPSDESEVLPSTERGKMTQDGEFSNWAGSVRNVPAKMFWPESTEDIQDVLSQAREASPRPRVRCTGTRHSWSPLFGDDGAWILDMQRMRDIVWSPKVKPDQITIGPGVTTGDLANFLDSKERGVWRGMYIPADVILEAVTYGGIINSGCHGTGKTQTIPDYVLATSIITWEGKRVDLFKVDDPKGFALKIIHFGLLGVTVAFTLQLDDRRTAVRVIDSKVEAREIFLEKDELPKPGGLNPLLELVERNYAIEIFYFPGSSLDIQNVLSSEFEDQRWDTYSDICAIKAFQRTENPVAKDSDYCCGINRKTSTRFDRNFSISDWVAINLGTQLALPLVSKYGDKPLLVASYSRAAAKAFEPFGKLKGEIVYEQSLAQAIHWQKYITHGYRVTDTEVCVKCDPDFTSAYKAIHSVLAITESFAEDEDTMPLNVAMEMRFTEHSDCPLSPAYGKKGDIFLWIEILSTVGTPKVKEYATRVADAWLAITLKDGSQAVRPHWAKWSNAYVADADAKIKKAYADHLPLLKRIAKEFDSEGMFMNDHFSRLFSGL